MDSISCKMQSKMQVCDRSFDVECVRSMHSFLQSSGQQFSIWGREVNGCVKQGSVILNSSAGLNKKWSANFVKKA